MHDFVKDNQLQFGSSRFVCLPSKVVEHVCHVADVSICAYHKLGCLMLYHLNLVFLVSLVRVPDGTAVVEV